MTEKMILDVTCGDRTIWFQKNEPHTLYCDIRREEWEGDFGKTLRADGKKKHRHIVIDPDIQCSFTDLPFKDNTFSLIVFDPPHIENLSENAWMRKAYGSLDGDWKPMIRKGFKECMRVLRVGGGTDIQMVRHLCQYKRDHQYYWARTFIWPSLRQEDEYTLDGIYEIRHRSRPQERADGKRGRVMTEIKLTKRYPQSRTEDIVDAYMRGWNDALDAVQNGKFHIAERKDEPQKNCDGCRDGDCYGCPLVKQTDPQGRSE